MRHNLHIHTFRSNCGKPEMIIADIVERAVAAGFDTIGLTDHIDLGSAEELARLPADREDVERLRPPIEVLVGTEVTMLSPTRPALDPRLAGEADFVMISANHFHLTSIVAQPRDHTPEAIVDHALMMLEGAIATGIADIIGHPLVLGKTEWFAPERIIPLLTRDRLAPVLAKAAEQGTAMELQPRRVALFREFYEVFIPACIEQGVRFTLGSDAHTLDGIPYCDDGVYRGAGPDDLAALGVREHDLVNPAEFPRV